jgi:hypothetical protein
MYNDNINNMEMYNMININDMNNINKYRTDSDDTIINVLEIENIVANKPLIKKQIITIYEKINGIIYNKNKEKNYYVYILIQISIHILLLSLFETLFFFKFITKIESELFIKEIINYLNIISNIQQNNLLNNDEEFYNNNEIIDYIDIKMNTYIINYVDKLYNNYNYYKNYREDYNNKLQYISFKFIIILGMASILMILIFKCKYKIHIFKILMEHLILMFFIALYELWFFTNIILRYKLVTSEELKFLITTCVLKITDENYDMINLNSTITSKCKII